MKYSCCVLVAWFLCVISLGWAQQWEGDRCLRNDGTVGVCRLPDNCPNVSQEIRSGKYPPICSHSNRGTIMCCSPSEPTATTTTTTTTTTTMKTTTSTATPTADNIPSRIATDTSMVDNNTIAGQKCYEYGSYVYWNVSSPSLSLPWERELVVNKKADCAMVVETLIIGGVQALRKEFPHMAALGYGRIEAVQWQCGGSLISERFVVTAAHCLYSREYGEVKFVRLGDLNLQSSEDDENHTLTIAVAERIKHDGYIPPGRYNDIALLKLERNVKFSPYIRPACLHTLPGNPQGKPKATASGWGKFEWDTDMMSNTLMKVDLAFQNESRCNHTFRINIKPTSSLKNGITPDSMICAGDPLGEKDTCGGDSGGPLQIRLRKPDPYCMYSIVGLVSFGPQECAAGDSPAVYTRVSNYIPWIENHVWPQLK